MSCVRLCLCVLNLGFFAMVVQMAKDILELKILENVTRIFECFW